MFDDYLSCSNTLFGILNFNLRLTTLDLVCLRTVCTILYYWVLLGAIWYYAEHEILHGFAFFCIYGLYNTHTVLVDLKCLPFI